MLNEANLDPSVASLLELGDGMDPERADMIVAIGDDILRMENEMQGPDHRLNGHLGALPANAVVDMRDRIKVMLEAEKMEYERRRRALNRVLSAVQGALGEGRG